jgi:hypothetical protein
MTSNPLIWLTDIAILASLWTLGILTVKVLLSDSTLPEQLSVGFGLGLGMFTWLLFICSWIGLPLTKPIILFLFLLLLIPGIVIALKANHGKFPSTVHSSESSHRAQGIPDIIGWILLAVFGVILMLLSISLSYYFWDAMAIWSVKGYGIGTEHSIYGAMNWGSKGLAYPLNIPLAISIFFAANQDLLPGSKLVFPGFFISMLIGLRVLFRRQQLPAWFAWCAVFAIGTVPLLVQYSIIGYANIPYAYYYVMGIIWVGLGLHEKDPQRVLLGSILLALSIWTRLEGLEFWLVAVVSVAVVWKKDFFGWKTIFRVLIPALIIGGSWIVFGRLNHASSGETALLSEAFLRLFHGEMHPDAVYKILRFTAYLVTKTRVYGILVPAMIGLAFLSIAINNKSWKDRLSMTLLTAGFMTGAGVVFMYYLTSYDHSSDLLAWLGTGYDRMLFAALILSATASATIIWKTWFEKTDDAINSNKADSIS